MQGVSIRLMRGVSYRISACRGQPVATPATELADVGTSGLTDRQIYFAGARRSFRIPYRKIVAVRPFEDGIGIRQDGVRARPQRFKTKDGAFTYTLLQNLLHPPTEEAETPAGEERETTPVPTEADDARSSRTAPVAASSVDVSRRGRPGDR
jgi:hypothetical protein